MSENLFGNLLDGKNRDQANKNLYNSFNTRNNLTTEVENAVGGLKELKNAIQQAQHVAKHNNSEARHMRQQFDKIAVLFEDFVNDFKTAYEEINAIEIAQRLSEEDNVKSSTIKNGFISSIDTTKLINNHGHTFVDNNLITTANIVKTPTVTWDDPDKKVGWNKKGK